MFLLFENVIHKNDICRKHHKQCLWRKISDVCREFYIERKICTFLWLYIYYLPSYNFFSYSVQNLYINRCPLIVFSLFATYVQNHPLLWQSQEQLKLTCGILKTWNLYVMTFFWEQQQKITAVFICGIFFLWV